MPFDTKQIPDGYTKSDVKTFYYDKNLGLWQQLELASLDETGEIVTSNTDHFTDMINAVVTVPDSPETQIFNPNPIKIIQLQAYQTRIRLLLSLRFQIK